MGDGGVWGAPWRAHCAAGPGKGWEGPGQRPPSLRLLAWCVRCRFKSRGPRCKSKGAEAEPRLAGVGTREPGPGGGRGGDRGVEDRRGRYGR